MTTRSVEVPVVLAERYQLGELIGSGGVAQVFRAQDLLLHRDVAVKLFGPGIDPSGPERERAEMRVLAGLSHPNLVTLHDAGTDHDHAPPRAYFVMALVDGLSLAQQLRSGPLPAAQVRDLGAQVADALAYVHGRGVVHRDVKPANILLDRNGRPFLADFGIARAVDAAALTAAGDTVGTAAYLSPEQVKGGEVGPAADVYALGLVLLEALTGVREYPGTTVETALARLNRAPRIDDSVPADLRELLVGMTATDAPARPSSEQVAARLSGATDADATQLIPTASLAPGLTAVTPPEDATRLLTTASVLPGRPEHVRGRAATGGGELRERFDDVWERARPRAREVGERLRSARSWAWAPEHRRAVAVVLGAFLLLVVVLVMSSGGSSGTPAGVAPEPPSGNPGPSRLGPDLDRLDELVQP